MTWLERINNAVKFKLGTVIAVLSILGVFSLILVSGYLNFLQKKTAISDEILLHIIQFVSMIVGAIIGYLFKQNEKDEKSIN